jgi:protocatechuate 3,4-dioxygenase beta subunit
MKFVKTPNSVNRRHAFRLFGAAAMASLPFSGRVPLLGQSACETLASPSLTEGPYFVEEDLNRSDIRNDPSDGSTSPGVPLVLRVNVSKLVNCNKVPLTGAYVDIWHCDAAGVYSDVSAQGSVGKKFLRGYLPTDRHGNVEFTTVYPGWYQGRAVHIHAKVRMFDGEDQTYEFTSQFFFDESVTDDVYTASPYNRRSTSRDTRNTNDGIYNGSSSLGDYTSNSGSQLMLNLTRQSSWVEAQASLICDLNLGSSPDQTPGGGGPGGGGPGGPPPGGTPPPRP